jgi:hypothetical protein
MSELNPTNHKSDLLLSVLADGQPDLLLKRPGCADQSIATLRVIHDR